MYKCMLYVVDVLVTVSNIDCAECEAPQGPHAFKLLSRKHAVTRAALHIPISFPNINSLIIAAVQVRF